MTGWKRRNLAHPWALASPAASKAGYNPKNPKGAPVDANICREKVVDTVLPYNLLRRCVLVAAPHLACCSHQE
jgi:hypothetical protein